jgi:pilus assembly protein CpaB
MGLITSILVYRAVHWVRAPQVDLEEIVVAAANVGPGEALASKQVKLAAWPKSSLPREPLRSIRDVEGRVARASIIAGEPIHEAKLAPAGQGGLMPILVPSGKRGVTIKVDEAVQKSGFVLPNSRVDVLVTMARKMGEGRASRIVLQDVAVLAADQSVEMKDNRPVTMTTVTMALSPEEAERLALSQNEGKVTLAIRNLKDDTRVSTPGVTTGQLMGEAAPPPKREEGPISRGRSTTRRPPDPVRVSSPPPPQIHTVSVIRGIASTEYSFVRDLDRGWRESPNTSNGAKKSP